MRYDFLIDTFANRATQSDQCPEHVTDDDEAPWPNTLRPASSSCTVTSPIASVRRVTPGISYRSSLADVFVTCEIARHSGSTGPSPIAALSLCDTFHQ